MKSILLCGVGGQGTVLASKLIAQAAMEQGLQAKSAETIGMAQRGGCVVSHVRIGKEIHSPLIPFGKADAIIGFEPAEAVRSLPYLKEGGTVIVSPKAIKPITSTLGTADYDGKEAMDFLKSHVKQVIIVDGEEICKECNSSKVLNVALLGAATASGIMGITAEQMEQAIINKVPQKFLDLNKKALSLGVKAYQEN